MGPAWVHMSVDGVVSNTPCLIFSVIVTPDGAATQADATLYDGVNSGEVQILTFRTLAGDTKQVIFVEPLRTQRGLYLDVGSNVEDVLICFSTWRE